MLEEPDYVFLAEESSYFYRHGNSCDLLLLPACYFKMPSSFAITKGSQLKDVFDTWILKMVEAGIVERLVSHQMSKIHRCYDLVTEQIDLDTVASAFLIFLVGALAALLIFLWECQQRRISSATRRLCPDISF